MEFAFFRGFLAGADDERQFETTNPYPMDSGTPRRYWELGQAAGLRANVLA
jgi:hypothetical protein